MNSAEELVRGELVSIEPLDALEQAHLRDALNWVDSGAPLFRVGKPAVPPKHLVSYIAILDGEHILLVDHKNARRWLPAGGHVEAGESPRETVVREVREELGLDVGLNSIGPPRMITVTETVGLTAGHVDVSLWYVVPVSRAAELRFDREEFNEARWFSFEEARALNSDPHLDRFLRKCGEPSR